MDANNLYGYAMFEFLPKGIFKWIHTVELDLNKYNKNSLNGFDLEYPKKICELQNDYPLATDKKIKRICYLSINY